MEGGDKETYDRINDTKNKMFQSFMQFEHDHRAEYAHEHDNYQQDDHLNQFAYNYGQFPQMNRKYFLSIYTTLNFKEWIIIQLRF
jgi:hypothetical protein